MHNFFGHLKFHFVPHSEHLPASLQGPTS